MEDQKQNQVPQNMRWAYLDHRSGLWAAQVRFDGRKYHLGMYETAEGASQVAQAFLTIRLRSKGNSYRVEKKTKLSHEKAAEIRERFGKGESITALAVHYGVSYSTIVDVIEYRTWIPKEEGENSGL